MVMRSFGADIDLLVTRFNVPFVWEEPYLQKLNRRTGIVVILGMVNAGSGAHYLYFAGLNNGYVIHAVLVLQLALEGDGDDLHIIVRVFAKAHATVNGIIIQHT